MTTPLPAGTPRDLRLKVLAIAIVLVGVVLDLWTKSFMQGWLGMVPKEPNAGRTVEVVSGFFYWRGTWNSGITFGLAQGWTYWILLFTVVACVGIAAWLVLTRATSRLFHVGLAMILGGALGNLYDRFMWQEVRDFVVVYYWPGKEWPAFNVADSMIVVGVILILWRELFLRGREGRPVAPAGAQP